MGRLAQEKGHDILSIRYFCISNQIKMEILTEKMWGGDYMSKPLQGKKFIKFCNLVLNMKQEKNHSLTAKGIPSAIIHSVRKTDTYIC